MAIDYLYEKMGINKEDIVYIDSHELSTYKGEYVILPVTMPLVDYCEKGIAGRFSDYIIPCFLGFTMARDELKCEEIEYLKKYAPIGCRDERTLSTMRRYGIESWLHGCITIILPKRDTLNAGLVPYIVDVDEGFLKYIPEEIKKHARYKTHYYKCNEIDEDEIAFARRQYHEYYENASLMITSLLHSASPCIAAGIPTIILKKTISYRFGWIDKLTRIYTDDTVGSIDWDHVFDTRIDIEEHKRRVFNISKHRLMSSFSKFKDTCDLSWYYEDRNKNEYSLDFGQSIKAYIDKNWEKDKHYRFSVWGLTQMTEWVVSYIKKNYDAELSHVYDTFRRVSFEGVESEYPDSIEDSDETLFVTSAGAVSAAKEMMDSVVYKHLRLVCMEEIF